MAGAPGPRSRSQASIWVFDSHFCTSSVAMSLSTSSGAESSTGSAPSSFIRAMAASTTRLTSACSGFWPKKLRSTPMRAPRSPFLSSEAP